MTADGAPNTSQTPLAGVVTCCTSIVPERRGELTAIITELGGVNKLDLTSDVTHLIVGGYDTPKYKYVAKERPDVKCLLPEWLDAVRASWLDGGETDVEKLEEEYRLPTFHHMRICVTGFQDCKGERCYIYKSSKCTDCSKVQTRKSFEEKVNANGGEYTGDLTKEVTHLIAAVPSGAKYVHGKQWGLHVVSPEWFHQSLERGMILDETLYDPLMEASIRGEGAWVRRSVSTTSLGKRARQESGVGTRKLRRTASAKFSSQSDALWGDIMGGGFTPKEVKKGEWDDNEDQGAPTIQRVETPTLPNIPHAGGAAVPAVRKSTPKRGILHGKRFYIHGFDAKQSAILEKHLYSHEAEILPDVAQLSQAECSSAPSSSFVLVPHASSGRDVPSTPDASPQAKIVNDLWLEKCLHSKQYVEPETNASYTPFEYPIKGFEKLTVSTTGFQDIELLHIGKTIRLLGANYAGTLTKEISALVCHSNISPSREKVHFAIKWGVPVVKADWLWECMKSGKPMSFWDYLVHPDRQSRPKPSTNEDEEEGDRDFHNPKRNAPGQRKRELDYGGQRTWLRRKSTGGGDANDYAEDTKASKDQTTRNEPTTTTAHDPTTAVDDSFSVPDESADDTLDVYGAETADTFDGLIAQHIVRPVPLRERSSNSPTKTASAPKALAAQDLLVKPPSYTKVKDPQQESLNSAISDLLAKRQRDASSGPSALDTANKGRRKRTLLGRASSNLSARSASHISRASSVDTVNTDGLGTPLENSIPISANGTKSFDPLTEALLGAQQEEEKPEEQPPMTQVGYAEEEADVWREKVAREKGWKTDKDPAAEAGRKVKRVLSEVEGTRTFRRTRQSAR